MDKEINKPTWRPRFLSEYSMGELDFRRFDKTLNEIDYLSALVNSCHIPELDLMQQFFAQLINLYDDFRPLISFATVTREFDGIISKGIKIKRLWEQSKKSGIPMNQKQIFEFVDLCRALKTKLYSTKQVMGLGIAVKKYMSTAEKIKKGIRGNIRADDLPEA